MMPKVIITIDFWETVGVIFAVIFIIIQILFITWINGGFEKKAKKKEKIK